MRRSLKSPCVLFLLSVLAYFPAAQSASLFLSAGDAQLRSDVTLLVDEDVIALPTSAWPIPRAELVDAVARAQDDTIAAPALRAALGRVRSVLRAHDISREWGISEVKVSAGRAGLLRGYETPAREDFEVSSAGGVVSERWGLRLSATFSPSPPDEHDLRLDGSDLTVRWGNWLLSVNQMDRWWGPGWDGNLILSNNARPMPAVSLDRVHSLPFDFPVLRWFGPWRFSAFVARADRERSDVDESLFMGMRLSFKPLQILELGLSRSAQFCGRGRPCRFTTFKDVLLGNDNAGLRVAPEDEPGNQMAGFDVRLVSPWRSLPLAVYGQFIGEDNSSSGIPERYLGLFGAEYWKLLEAGGALRVRVEYADTSCKFDSPGENPDCAYRQGIFRDGYRFHRRNIGHTTDTDSESFSATVTLTQPAGDQWGLQFKRATLDRYGAPDPFNSVTFGPGDFRSLQAFWSGRFLGQDFSIQGGYQRARRGNLGDDDGAVGFVVWRKML